MTTSQTYFIQNLSPRILNSNPLTTGYNHFRDTVSFGFRLPIPGPFRVSLQDADYKWVEGVGRAIQDRENHLKRGRCSIRQFLNCVVPEQRDKAYPRLRTLASHNNMEGKQLIKLHEVTDPSTDEIDFDKSTIQLTNGDGVELFEKNFKATSKAQSNELTATFVKFYTYPIIGAYTIGGLALGAYTMIWGLPPMIVDLLEPFKDKLPEFIQNHLQ